MTKTKSWLHAALAAMVLLCLAGAWQRGLAQEKAPADRTLKVKLNYSGAGTVDEKHRIFVFLFDAPDFVQRQDAMPIANGSGTAKNETLTLSGLATSPVYLVAVYDPSGNYDGMSRPPSGASLAIYGKTPGTPDAIVIEAGKPTQIDVPFADGFKMP